MRIPEILAKGPCFSFEFFPPKTEVGERQLWGTLRELAVMRPGFVSVTDGAGGSTRGSTREIATRIKAETSIEPMAHLAVRGQSEGEIRASLSLLAQSGVENVLCLRGDKRAKENEAASAFAYASDLIGFVRSEWKFALGGACYPEGHNERVSLDADLNAVRVKVAAGAEFLITQLFLDNAHYFDFVTRARAAGIDVPIIPGLMPITNVAQIERFTQMCGVSIPPELREQLNHCREDAVAVEALGTAHCTQQALGLMARGAPGVHFYTLNRSPATRTVLAALQRAGV